MSGTRLPIRMEALGKAEVEAALQQIAQAGVRAMEQVNKSTATATVTMSGFTAQINKVQSALDIVGSAVPGLSAITGPLSAAANSLDALNIAATVASNSTGGLLARLIALGTSPLGTIATLGSIALASTRAGEAATSTDEAMRRWNATLQALAPSLDAVERSAIAAANAQRLQQATQLEGDFGRVITRRGSIVGEMSVADRREAAAAASLAAAQARQSRYQPVITSADEANRAPDPVGDALAADVEAAAQNLARVTETRTRLVEEYRTLEAQDAAYREVSRRLAAPIVYAAPIGPQEATPTRASGNGGGRAAAAPTDYSGQVEATLDRIRQANEKAGQAIAASLDPAYAALLRYQDALKAIDNGTFDSERRTELQALAQRRYNDELERGERSVTAFGKSASAGLGKAVDQTLNAVLAGKKLGDVLKDLESDLARLVLQSAITRPLESALTPALSAAGQSVGSAVSGLFNAKGNAFDAGGVMPFAKGGVVDRPTIFPFARGTGLMGEAGPEAILPLRRGADGSLGVQANGGGGGAYTFAPNITIDARGAEAGTEAKIAAAAQYAIAEAQKQFLVQIARGGSTAKAVGRRR